MKKKVVLAFSGGLDTSFCAKYLAENDFEVYSVFINTGGFDSEEVNQVEKNALSLGVFGHKTIDVTGKYYQKCLRFLVYGNVLKNGTYPLSVSSERIFQAVAVAEYAKEISAEYVAHGSTGAGNDQVRFDLIFNILIPDVEILTPVRDQKLSREEEIQYLKSNGVNSDWQKAEYSINKGLWGTSIGGKETLTSHLSLPEKAFRNQVTKQSPEVFRLLFEHGQFIGFNGITFSSPVEAINALNKQASCFGVGRDIHVGDTIIGIKGRVGFEAAAPLLIIKSHQALEKHVLTKWQIYWKDQLANWYGMMLHEGQFLDPVMRDIETFLENSQSKVSGIVIVKIAPYFFQIEGIESPHDLMSGSFGTYGEMNAGWEGTDVRGFAKMLSNQTRIYKSINKD